MLTGESTSSNYQSPDQRPFVVGKSDKVKAQPQSPQNKIQLSKKK